MNLSIKLRLTALGVGLGLMGALIVAVTLTSQHQAEVARSRLGQVDLESIRIADRFKDKLRYASDQMRRYSSGRQEAVWKDFLSAGEDLRLWIETQAPRLTSGLEQKVLKQMEAAYAVYLQRAQDLHARMETTGESSASLAEYNSFFEQSRHLNDLGVDLARIHYESRNGVLAHANRTLTQLRLSVLGLVALLFVFGIALAAGV